MKILLIHNAYNKYSGEEAVVEAQIALLKANGHDVQTYMRGSSELKGMRMGHAQGFLSGLHSRKAIREIREIVGGQEDKWTGGQADKRTGGQADGRTGGQADGRTGGQEDKRTGGQADKRTGGQADGRTGGQADRSPQSSVSSPIDIVHIHNLYPLISPAILPVIKLTHQFTSSPAHQLTSSPARQLTSSPAHQLTSSPPKIVMTVHNYRLICPNGLFFTHGEICEQCAGGREWNCIIRNCEGSVSKSTGYALRNYWARKKRYYLDNVDAFLCLTDFQKNKLVENGFPAGKCFVLPNFLQSKKPESKGPMQSFALFAGRINAQKGFDILAKAASSLPGIPFRVAGTGTSDYITSISLPPNIEMAGKLQRNEMEQSFQNASFLVFTSRSYEGFPMVFLEAMAAGIPVIAPGMAGFPEIIEDGFNGFLFNPGDAEDLAKKIKLLWNDPDLRVRLGENGRKKLETQYSPEVYYRKLMAVYEQVG